MAQRLNEDLLRWFNTRYATVEIEGKFGVLRVEDEAIYSPTDFKDSLAHMTTTVNGRDVLLPAEWLKDERRRHYPKGVEFDPSKSPSVVWDGSHSPPCFNLWRGLAVKPSEGNVGPFIGFVKEIICDGDVGLFDFVLAWFSNLIQTPATKPGTALVLIGDQGVGKTFFTSTIGQIFGDGVHYIELSDPVHLVGRFNHHLRDKLLVVAEESAYAGRKAADKLKSMITSDTLLVEQKFRTPYTVRSYARLIINGNHERLIQASHDERRYCVLRISSKRQGDTTFFAKLDRWRKDGGFEALLHFLTSHEHNINLRTVPRTKALFEQQIAGLDDLDRWWLDTLHEGRLGPGRPWNQPIPCAELHDNYVAVTNQVRDRSSQTQFGMRLRKRVPGITKTRITLGGGQVHCYQFPHLDKCRAAFESRFKTTIKWAVAVPELELVKVDGTAGG